MESLRNRLQLIKRGRVDLYENYWRTSSILNHFINKTHPRFLAFLHLPDKNVEKRVNLKFKNLKTMILKIQTTVKNIQTTSCKITTKRNAELDLLKKRIGKIKIGILKNPTLYLTPPHQPPIQLYFSKYVSPSSIHPIQQSFFLLIQSLKDVNGSVNPSTFVGNGKDFKIETQFTILQYKKNNVNRDAQFKPFINSYISDAISYYASGGLVSLHATENVLKFLKKLDKMDPLRILLTILIFGPILCEMFTISKRIELKDDLN